MSDRLSFQSAGATRKRDRREPETIRIAFADLLVRLADNPPANIIGLVDAADLEERADHLQRLLSDVGTYITAVLTDAKYTASVQSDVNVMGLLEDMRGDIVGAFKNAAEQMREYEAEFADEFE